MEGPVMAVLRVRLCIAVGLCCLINWTSSLRAQEPPASGQAEINLRRSAQTRPFQGRDVEGEERQIGPGDTLWRILVRDKGLPEQKFRSYLVVIRGLNPQIKDPQVLRVGDKIFIPLRPDQVATARASSEIPEIRSTTGRGGTTNYRVKTGEHLYQILREQLKLTDDRKVAQYYALVKDLNPERKTWDTLTGGEIIRLPVIGQQTAGSDAMKPPRSSESLASENRLALDSRAKPGPAGADGDSARSATIQSQRLAESRPAMKTPAPSFTYRDAMQAPAKEQMVLFASIAEALGGEMQNSGEEVFSIKDGNVRLDKSSYPIVYSPVLRQKVVIDPDGKIPVSLRSKLADPAVGTPIVPMANNVSIREAVGQLLAGLGYQSLPSDRPVTIQEEGVSYEAKGGWIALAPEQSNKTQEVYVISLTEEGGDIPEYLKIQLQKNGLHLKDIHLSGSASQPVQPTRPEAKGVPTQAKSWPRDKREMVDALLFSLGVPFGVAENISVKLHDGLRIDTRTDRLFELAGKKTALFFQRPDPEIVKALQENQGVRAVAIDLASLSSRDVIGGVLMALGDQTTYREHRFAAANGAAKDRLTVTAWGFHLPRRSMFITDRQIPPGLHRFFFEKGLEIVYFQ
jgi:LysM domain